MKNENAEKFTLLKKLLSQENDAVLKVIVTPKSQKNIIQNITSKPEKKVIEIKVKIRGLPQNNQVNQNLIKFLAKELGIGISEIQIISGHHSRHKIVWAGLKPTPTIHS